MSERTREWTRSRRSANTFFPRAAQQPHVGQLYEWATLFVGDYFCKTDVREICSRSANPNGGASDLFKNNDDDGHLCFNFIYTYASHTHTCTSRSIQAQFISFIAAAERPLENEPLHAHWRTFGCRAAELRAKFMAFLSDSLKSCRILHRDEDEIYIKRAPPLLLIWFTHSFRNRLLGRENEAPDGDGFCDRPDS